MFRSARFAAGAVFAGLLLAFAASSEGAPFTPRFDDIKLELETRRDVDLAGELDKAGKKQLKAVVKSLAFIGKDADDLGDDLKTAGKISKLLQKAFPAPEGPSVQLDPLDGFLVTILDGLQGDVEADLQDLRDRVPDLTLKGATKVGKFVDKADAALLAVDGGNLPLRAKGLGKVWKLAAKGHKAADKDPGAPQLLSVTVDETTYHAGEIVIFYDGATGLLMVTATGMGPDFSLNLSPPPGIEGPGEYGLDTAQFALPGEPGTFYGAFSGTIVIDTVDETRRRMTGSFSFTGEGEQGTEGTAEITGTFDASYDSP